MKTKENKSELSSLFTDRVIFGSTEITDKRIKILYPNAKFVPVCAFDLYYAVYSDETYSEQIAEYRYLKDSTNVLKEIKNEVPCFGSLFQVNILI